MWAAAQLAVSAAAAAAAASEVWVDCGSGDDSHAGTAAAPFATLTKARDALRDGRAAVAQQRHVHVAAGSACRTAHGQALTLDARDSHTAWRGAGGAVLSGGLPIAAADYQPLTAAQRGWFKPSVRDKVKRVSLAGVADVGKLKGLSYTGGDACIRADFYEEVGLELIDASAPTAGSDLAPKVMFARFPNAVTPPQPSSWADYRDPDNTELALTIDATAEQLAAWQAQVAGGGPELWTHGLWTFNWADSHRQVLNVSAAGASAARLALQEHGDFTDRDCQLTAAKPGAQGGHVYVYNSLHDLDQPGEYVIDHAAKMAYVYPPTDSPQLEMTVATSLVVVEDAEGITFEGLSFRGARGAAIVLRNSTGVVVSDGAVSDCGMSAFNVTGGSGCGLQNMSVVRAGTGGAVLEGGDRATLTPSGHFVKASQLRHSNRW